MKSVYEIAQILLCFMLALLAPGCATPGQTAGAGAAAGGLAGAGVGLIADPGRDGSNRFRNVLIGTAVGSAVGAGAGYMIGAHEKSERDTARADGKREALEETRVRETASSAQAPRLLPARTEAHWVPDQVRGNTFVPGHFEFEIVEAARWQEGR